MNSVYRTVTSMRKFETRTALLKPIVQELSVQVINKLNGEKYGAWYEKETSGSLNGYELFLQDGNRIFIDIELKGDYVLLYKLFIKEKGTGLGSRILNTLKQYVDDHGGTLMVCLVINQEFFNKFDWLEFDEYQNYEYRSLKESLMV
ncbi:hypothetical protein [Bacillus benzoevorans]|uniref:GNAT superfamily N-acetyltransferase n=1 Tax=Bacillus benzoevorans TaxID=1456 RepID=A0A7X0LV91_9BACI|nr:hypothetical protein [Bacillus benzoevorans]MBB6444059.1 GNAT superfamily N-acetyltransferase [Bacillus benzoevorans]